MAADRQISEAQREEIRKRHGDVLRAGADARMASEAGGETEDSVPPLAEDIASIELMLPDGRAVIMAPPQGSLLYRIATMTAGDPAGQVLSVMAQALLSIVTIGGEVPPQISNKIDLLKWVNDLGDRTVDILVAAYNDCWPPITRKDLVIVKKNLRQPRLA